MGESPSLGRYPLAIPLADTRTKRGTGGVMPELIDNQAEELPKLKEELRIKKYVRDQQYLSGKHISKISQEIETLELMIGMIEDEM